MSFMMHVLYFALFFYAYKAYETYQIQRSLAVGFVDSLKAGLLWPKFLF